MNTETNYAEHFYADISNDIDTLRKNVNENPFSSVAQFLLLYNYKKNNDSSFEKYAKQTAIYFNNITWIQYQLAGVGTDPFAQTILPLETHEEITADAPIIENPNRQPGTGNEATKETVGIADTIQTLGVDEIQETISTANEPAYRSGRPTTENPNEESETGNEEKKETAGITDNIQTLGVDQIQETSSTADETIIENPNQEPETGNKEKKETSDISDSIQTLGTDEIQERHFTADEQITQNPNQKFATENEEKNESEEKKETLSIADNTQTLGVDEIQETSSTAIEAVIENPNQESENEEKFVAFEPLHAVDYFASQGIKLPEEALENDHLGQQVKSFTAWLKSMKKLHPGQLPEQNEVIEKIIQSSAEVSNQNANVLTEAMAEVLIKQNKKQKAVEMYEKLSLMNPSKSSYFAAKIESLKTI